MHLRVFSAEQQEIMKDWRRRIWVNPDGVSRQRSNFQPPTLESKPVLGKQSRWDVRAMRNSKTSRPDYKLFHREAGKQDQRHKREASIHGLALGTCRMQRPRRKASTDYSMKQQLETNIGDRETSFCRAVVSVVDQCQEYDKKLRDACNALRFESSPSVLKVPANSKHHQSNEHQRAFSQHPVIGSEAVSALARERRNKEDSGDGSRAIQVLRSPFDPQYHGAQPTSQTDGGQRLEKTQTVRGITAKGPLQRPMERASHSEAEPSTPPPKSSIPFSTFKLPNKNMDNDSLSHPALSRFLTASSNVVGSASDSGSITSALSRGMVEEVDKPNPSLGVTPFDVAPPSRRATIPRSEKQRIGLYGSLTETAVERSPLDLYDMRSRYLDPGFHHGRAESGQVSVSSKVNYGGTEADVPSSRRRLSQAEILNWDFDSGLLSESILLFLLFLPEHELVNITLIEVVPVRLGNFVEAG